MKKNNELKIYIQCPECGSDNKKKYSHYKLEDHFKNEHVLESLAVNYCGYIFRLHKAIKMINIAVEGLNEGLKKDPFATEKLIEIEMLKNRVGVLKSLVDTL